MADRRRSQRPEVSDIRFRRAGHADLRTGLIGYVSFLLDGHTRVDGVTVRETRDGRRVLSFPMKKHRDGREHPYLRPVDDAARVAIEQQVLDAVGVDPWRQP